jgi:putative NADH-flavin reductase
VARLLLFGATGGVGHFLLERLLADGHDVTAVVRDSSKLDIRHESLRLLAGDVTDPACAPAAVPGHDAVLCALGTGGRGPTTLFSTAAANVAPAMEASGVRRLVFLSNFGVLSEAAPDLRWAIMMPFARFKIRHLLRDHVAAIDEVRRRDVDWTFVRPMILTDGPMTGRYRVNPDGLPRGGLNISRADVADFMARQIGDDEFVGRLPSIAY